MRARAAAPAPRPDSPPATRRGRRRMAARSGARPAELSGVGAQRALRVGARRSRPQAGRRLVPGPAARARRPGWRPGAHAPRDGPRGPAQPCGRSDRPPCWYPVGGETGRRKPSRGHLPEL